MSGEEGRRGTWGDGATEGLYSGRVGESLPVAKYFRLATISQSQSAEMSGRSSHDSFFVL